MNPAAVTVPYTTKVMSDYILMNKSDKADIIVSLWLASDERTGTNNSPQSFFFSIFSWNMCIVIKCIDLIPGYIREREKNTSVLPS